MNFRPVVKVVGLLSSVIVVIGVVYALWWRKHPSPCPYSQRFWVELPRPVVTRSRLRAVLDPGADERILEGGRERVLRRACRAPSRPDGTLHALDIQRAMLENTRTRAQKQGVQNIEVVNADAQTLPYSDASFDAAYLILVLGEVPDQDRALRELNRVLKPGGRLVVGERFPDPHFVAFGTLRHRAERQGFQFADRNGHSFGYFARFSVPP